MQAIIKGQIMGFAPKSRTNQRTGQIEHSLQVDVYQADSPSANKTISVKVNDTSLEENLRKFYPMGTAVELTVSVSAFNGNIYATYVDGISVPVPGQKQTQSA